MSQEQATRLQQATTGRPRTRFSATLRKLRGRTLAELRVRTAQATAACLERLGLSADSHEPSDRELWSSLDSSRCSARLGDATALLTHFKQRTQPRFFAGFDDWGATLSVLSARWTEETPALLGRADRIGKGRFDLLGHADLSFGSPIDWQRDPVACLTAPRTHWSRIAYLDPHVVGDHKLVWELNRHQHFAILGRAYWRSEKEAYARTFVRHLTEWMDANPPTRGVNWASSLEVAFRAIAWMWALHFFRSSPALTPAVFVRVLKWLYLHGRHLEKFPSTYFSPNTHLTGEALGLIYLGTLFPEFRRSPTWRAKGWRILRDQAQRQVRPDGGYFERSSYYHRYTADIYLHAVLLAQANGDAIDPLISDTLEALLDHLLHLTRPDGRTPLLGDDDGGRVIGLDNRAPNDFRAALAVGAVLFDRADYAYVAGDPSEETLWLLGADGVRRFDQLSKTRPRGGSRAFLHSGYFVMRDGWDERSNYILITCGPYDGLASGHAHADALAFELAAYGRPFIVDAGTFTYMRSLSERNQFRCTAAHNTVTVDGESSSLPGSPFQWSRVARASLVAWVSRSSFDYFEGAHDGYRRLAAPATHNRGILFLKAKYWIMRDRIHSAGYHRVSVRFHFAPDLTVHAARSPVSIVATPVDGSVALGITSFSESASLVCEDGWISSSYGTRERATACSVVTEGTGTQEIITFLLPGVSDRSGAVRRMDAVACKAFEILEDDARDTLLLDAGANSEAKGITADASWAWVRRSQATGDIQEFLLISGRMLGVEGVRLVATTDVAGFVAGWREGWTWHIETNAESPVTLTVVGTSEIFVNGRAYAVSGSTVTVAPHSAPEPRGDRAIQVPTVTRQ